jgi:hypothetical protein
MAASFTFVERQNQILGRNGHTSGSPHSQISESILDVQARHICFVIGPVTDVAMLLLTFAIPRGGSFLRDAQAAQFPVTVGVWAIFVLLFVKLK